MNNLKKITLFSLLTFSTFLYANKIVGTLEPYSKTTIKSEISGVIKKINYNIGDNKTKGELLVKIDEKDYLLEYKMAKANEELSRVNYSFLKTDFERYNNLLKSKAITKQTHAERKKSYKLARVETNIASISTKQAKRNLEKTNIKAMYSGIISNKFIEVGDYVTNGDSLLEFVNDDKLKAVFYILQEDYENFKKGLEVNLVIPDLDNKKLKGSVNLIAPTIIGNNSGYRMEVLLDNAQREFKSNFEIELILDKEQ